MAVSDLLPEELELFLTSWINQKLLSLIIIRSNSYTLDRSYENKKIIETYIKLGVIKELETVLFQ